jgi:hypothetical protein
VSIDSGVPDSGDNDGGSEANPTDDAADAGSESSTDDGAIVDASDGSTCPGAAPVDAGAENVAQGGGVLMVTNCGGANVSVNEMPIKAFDNDTATKWLCFLQNRQLPTIEYRFLAGSTYAVNAYSVTSANDAAERDPGSWRLEGSNDGTTWTTVDEQSGQVFPFRFQTKTYTFSNCTAYARYRFVITELAGGDASTAAIFQVGEFQLFGPQGQVSPLPPNRTKGGVVTATACVTNNTRETPPFAFDSDFSTKWFCGNNPVPIIEIALTGPQPDGGVGPASRTITAYSISSANDSPDRDPKSWTLQGTNSVGGGATWTVVDTQNNQAFANRFQTNTYTVATPAAFTRYRLAVTNNGSNDSQIGEIMLFGN